MKLTPRQQEILDFIKSTLEVPGAPPTFALASRTVSGSGITKNSAALTTFFAGVPGVVVTSVAEG